jgi:hypothetical protein
MTEVPPVWTVRAEGHELDGYCTFAGPAPVLGDVIEVRQNVTGLTFKVRVTGVREDGPDRHVAGVEIEP